MGMRISKLTFLAFHLNGAVGSGKYDDISIEQIQNVIEDGTVFEFLKERLGQNVDLSLLEPVDCQELLEEWRGVVANVDERRKFCVERGGLCLLVAYLLEGIQERRE